MQTKKRKSSPQQGKQRKLPRKSSPQQGKQRKALHDQAAARLVKTIFKHIVEVARGSETFLLYKTLNFLSP